MNRKNRNLFFSTKIVDPGKVHTGLDRFFLRYSLPGYTKAELDQLIDIQYFRFKSYLFCKKKFPLRHAYTRNKLARTPTGRDITVNHMRRYYALAKVQKACAFIDSELYRGDYQRCVLFGMSKSVMHSASIYLHRYHPMVIYPGSDPFRVETCQKKFQGPRRRVIIVDIKAGFGLKLDCADRAFFIEESLDVSANFRALKQLYGKDRTKEIHVANFTLNDPVDMRASELLRATLMRKTNGQVPRLPERFL